MYRKEKRKEEKKRNDIKYNNAKNARVMREYPYT